MYDWANSGYSLVITATIFPVYFLNITGDGSKETLDTVHFMGHSFLNTALYNYSMATAFLVIAVFSPVLANIADRGGHRKTFLTFFMLLGSLATCCLYFFSDKSSIPTGILFMIIASIGFWCGNVFYNSFLPELSLKKNADRVSAKGFSYGYAGGLILQLICFAWILQHNSFSISKDEAVRMSFIIVGLWWFLFGLYSVNGIPGSSRSAAYSSLFTGYIELKGIFIAVQRNRLIRLFLLSFFFYIMGLQSVLLAATLYGSDELGLNLESLVISILIIQVIAIPGSYTIASLAKKINSIMALSVYVLIWIFICIAGYLLPEKNPFYFYILAGAVGFVMGGTQSLSRSTFAKLIPQIDNVTSYFSFYDVTEKLAIVTGMFCFGVLVELTNSQRSSVLMLVFLFSLGLIFLTMVNRSFLKQEDNKSISR